MTNITYIHTLIHFKEKYIKAKKAKINIYFLDHKKQGSFIGI